jgi:hypothetical protein
MAGGVREGGRGAIGAGSGVFGGGRPRVVGPAPLLAVVGDVAANGSGFGWWCVVLVGLLLPVTDHLENPGFFLGAFLVSGCIAEKLLVPCSGGPVAWCAERRDRP